MRAQFAAARFRESLRSARAELSPIAYAVRPRIGQDLLGVDDWLRQGIGSLASLAVEASAPGTATPCCCSIHLQTSTAVKLQYCRLQYTADCQIPVHGTVVQYDILSYYRMVV